MHIRMVIVHMCAGICLYVSLCVRVNKEKIFLCPQIYISRLFSHSQMLSSIYFSYIFFLSFLWLLFLAFISQGISGVEAMGGVT